LKSDVADIGLVPGVLGSAAAPPVPSAAPTAPTAAAAAAAAAAGSRRGVLRVDSFDGPFDAPFAVTLTPGVMKLSPSATLATEMKLSLSSEW
jgi:hypothetical protein